MEDSGINVSIPLGVSELIDAIEWLKAHKGDTIVEFRVVDGRVRLFYEVIE